MNQRIRRIALPICVALAALSAAPVASAASGNLVCEGSLTPQQASFEGSTTVPITLQGGGSCVRNNAVQAVASFTLSGNATIGNCFTSVPYIDITGTLTTSEVGGPTESTNAELKIVSLLGVNNGVGVLTTDAGQVGAWVVTFTDIDHSSLLGTISRCGGGAPFTLSATGAFII